MFIFAFVVQKITTKTDVKEVAIHVFLLRIVVSGLAFTTLIRSELSRMYGVGPVLLLHVASSFPNTVSWRIFFSYYISLASLSNVN